VPTSSAIQHFARLAAAVVLAIVLAAVAWQRLIGPDSSPTGAALTIVDGDTVRSAGVAYRLLGFDAPERGDRALCDKERELAERSASRLQNLIGSGIPKLTRVACPCSAGTEGSAACNEGRSCASLQIDGHDVGEILIREGFAQPFVCGRTSCPPRRPWC
jgi:endonuclease YncB( thermonuclease family)